MRIYKKRDERAVAAESKFRGQRFGQLLQASSRLSYCGFQIGVVGQRPSFPKQLLRVWCANLAGQGNAGNF